MNLTFLCVIHDNIDLFGHGVIAIDIPISHLREHREHKRVRLAYLWVPNEIEYSYYTERSKYIHFLLKKITTLFKYNYEILCVVFIVVIVNKYLVCNYFALKLSYINRKKNINLL